MFLTMMSTCLDAAAAAAAAAMPCSPHFKQKVNKVMMGTRTRGGYTPP